MIETVRKWEYKGMMLEVKKVSLISEDQWELAGLVSLGDTADVLKTGHHNGYVTVNKDLGNGELAKYLHDDYGHPAVEVHGGVTFYQQDGNNLIYGFDCAHFGDTIEYWDAERVSQECQNLANALRKIVGIMN